MSSASINLPPADDELARLVESYCDGAISSGERDRLELLLSGGRDAKLFFVAYLDLHAQMQWLTRGEKQEMENIEAMDAQPVVLSPSPLFSSLTPSFVGGPVFSYMVATVVLCLMLLGAWAYKITRESGPSYVYDSRGSTSSGLSDRQQMVFVGRITGMRDCRWADPDTRTIIGASVPLSRKYALASGLMEITYAGGAKVIIEGPCAYKVESSAGGFLARGKLTARIAQQGTAALAAGAKPQAVFSIWTPTALVTDLGTEFGVEVGANGDTTSYVFEGKVVVKAGIRGFGDSGIRESEKRPATAVAGGAAVDVDEIQLGPGEAVLVKRDEANTPRFTRLATPPKFVRRIYEPPKQLDLLDIVAGGNGTGNRRERGIDATTGMEDTFFIDDTRPSDKQYHQVSWHRLIDGVFSPYVPVGERDVQLDSAGHTFRGFTVHWEDGSKIIRTLTNGMRGPIWARAADIASDGRPAGGNGWLYVMGNGDQYMPQRRGLLGFHVNAGITFDMEAMRILHENVYPARLKAVAGMGEGPRKYEDVFGVADVWVFVDGELVWKRRDLRHRDGAVPVDVEIAPDARFLTLAATGGKGGQAYDWVVIGDPVLELALTETENRKED
ncbi:MAG: NPCBM/NEW2 domain-containing protein [Pirellulales bacterium]|nr:NPCBM/NEW2 domain-containing protein [Pirellulales bacterium]